MKLNEGHLSLGTVIIYFWDKPYQEINFKSDLNSVPLSIKILSDLHMSNFTLIFVCSYFCNEIEKCQLWKSLKYFNILWSIKHDVRFEYVPWKNVWFCFISIVWVHFNHKTDKFWFWKSLKYFIIFWHKKIGCQIWICPMEKYLILLHLHWLGSV